MLFITFIKKNVSTDLKNTGIKLILGTDDICMLIIFIYNLLLMYMLKVFNHNKK